MREENSWRDLREAEERVVRARKAENRQEEGNALVCLGLSQQEIGQLGEAIVSFERALLLLRPFQDEGDEVLVLRSLGSCLVSSGKTARAFALFDEALALARRGQNVESEFACLYQLGVAATALEKTQVAISSFQQALTIARIQGQKTDEIHTLGSLGTAYMQAGRIEEAIACHKQARTRAQQAGDLDGEAYELGNLGSAYACVRGEVNVGIGYYKQALDLFRQLGDEANSAKTLGNIGKALLDAHDPRNARPFLEQARLLALRIGDRTLLSAILSSLGDMEEDVGDIPSAIREHERAVEVARGKGEGQQEAQSLNALALLWKRIGHPQKALEYHHDALRLVQTRHDPLSAARLLGNIALVLDEIGEIGFALLLHKQALLLFQAEGDVAGQGRTLVYMGMSAFHQRNFARALADFRFGQALLAGTRAWEEERIAPTIEKMRKDLGESKFHRAWHASEQHARRLHFQHHWLLLGATPLKGESGNSLDPYLCAAGERQTALPSSLHALPEWLEARAHVDPEAWRTLFSCFERKQENRPGEGETELSRARGLRLLGCAYASAGSLQEAGDLLNLALSLFREQGDSYEVQLTLFTLATLFLRTNRWQEAQSFFNEALFCTIGFEEDAILAARSYRSVGVAFRLFDHLGRSRFFLEAALEMARSSGNSVEEGRVLSELGRTHSEWGHEQKAIQYHQRALDIFRQHHERVWEKEQLLWLARSYATAGKYTSAETLLRELQAPALPRREWLDAVRASIHLGILALLQENTTGYLMGLRQAMNAVPEEERQTRECIGRWISQLSLKVGQPTFQRLWRESGSE